jgi:hypothetical protein
MQGRVVHGRMHHWRAGHGAIGFDRPLHLNGPRERRIREQRFFIAVLKFLEVAGEGLFDVGVGDLARPADRHPAAAGGRAEGVARTAAIERVERDFALDFVQSFAVAAVDEFRYLALYCPLGTVASALTFLAGPVERKFRDLATAAFSAALTAEGSGALGWGFGFLATIGGAARGGASGAGAGGGVLRATVFGGATGGLRTGRGACATFGFGGRGGFGLATGALATGAGLGFGRGLAFTGVGLGAGGFTGTGAGVGFGVGFGGSGARGRTLGFLSSTSVVSAGLRS